MKNLFVICLLLYIFSCNSDRIIDTRNDDYLESCFNNYASIYHQINDTLQRWRIDSLESMIYMMNRDTEVLDSMIVFNSDSTRLFTYILLRDDQYKDAVFDNLQALGGFKINGIWLYFMGMQIVIDRDSYQDSIYSPLTFIELSFLAREHLQNAYTINNDRSILPNDSFFEFMYNRRGWGLSEESSLEQLDSFILKRSQEMRKKKLNVEELNEIKRDSERSNRPIELPNNISLWQKWFGEKKTIRK